MSSSGLSIAVSDPQGTLMRTGTTWKTRPDTFGVGVSGTTGERAWSGLEVLGTSPYQLAQHRLYDGETGRFSSADPIGLAGGMHRFVYAGNNPATWVDPTGWVMQSQSGFWDPDPIPGADRGTVTWDFSKMAGLPTIGGGGGCGITMACGKSSSSGSGAKKSAKKYAQAELDVEISDDPDLWGSDPELEDRDWLAKHAGDLTGGGRGGDGGGDDGDDKPGGGGGGSGGGGGLSSGAVADRFGAGSQDQRPPRAGEDEDGSWQLAPGMTTLLQDNETGASVTAYVWVPHERLARMSIEPGAQPTTFLAPIMIPAGLAVGWMPGPQLLAGVIEVAGLEKEATVVAEAGALLGMVRGVRGIGRFVSDPAGIGDIDLSLGDVVPRASAGSSATSAGQGPAGPTTRNRAVVEPGKWDYIFGRASGARNAEHNAPRTAQNRAQMRRIGVHNDPQGRALLQEFFDRVVDDPSNVTSTWTDEFGTFQAREGLLAGPGGMVKVTTTWEVMPDGTFRFTTMKPQGG